MGPALGACRMADVPPRRGGRGTGYERKRSGCGQRPRGDGAAPGVPSRLVVQSGAAPKRCGSSLHLGEQTAKRLAVHSALVGRNQSREADRILSRFLAREGRGPELFGDIIPTDEESAA